MIETTYSRCDFIILELLSEPGKIVSFNTLCANFDVSERTMRSVISEVDQTLKLNKLNLSQKKGKNYYVDQIDSQSKKTQKSLKDCW